MSDLAIVTTYYNYMGYQKIRENYFRFAQQIEDMGLHLFTMELACGDKPFEIEKSYKYRTQSALWYKENLINIAVKRHLSEQYKYVAWIDADVEFVGVEAFQELREKLNQFPVVQLFNKSIRLDKYGLPHEVACSYPYWLKAKQTEKSPPRCVPGFAWASSKDFLNRHGLYDIPITGSGDGVFATSLYGWFGDTLFDEFNQALIDDYKSWGDAVHKEIGGNVGYVNHVIKHWWHGDEMNRNYAQRNFLYHLYDFNPSRDLYRDEHGLLQWTEAGYLIGEAVKRYFSLRKEDA